VPTVTDTTIIVGSFAWFFILFLAFIKVNALRLDRGR